MTVGAQLSITDMRRASRHPVAFETVAENRARGEFAVFVSNVSNTGFLLSRCGIMERGERVTIRLPVVGRIEAFVVWADEARAGLQFERIVRPDDFVRLVRQMQPNPRLRVR